MTESDLPALYEDLLDTGSGSTSPTSGAPPLPLPSATPVFVGDKLASGPTDLSNGGGYQLSPEQLDEIIDQWKDLRDDLLDDERIVENLSSTTRPPGDEFASNNFVQKGVHSTLQAFYEKNIELLEYIEKYIEKLEKSKKAIDEMDEDAAQTASQAGAGLE